MYLLTHSLSPVLVLVVVMGSMELKIARLFSCSFSDSLSPLHLQSFIMLCCVITQGLFGLTSHPLTLLFFLLCVLELGSIYRPSSAETPGYQYSICSYQSCH